MKFLILISSNDLYINFKYYVHSNQYFLSMCYILGMERKDIKKLFGMQFLIITINKYVDTKD